MRLWWAKKKLWNIGIDLELILCCDLGSQKKDKEIHDIVLYFTIYAWLGYYPSLSFVEETMELALFCFEYHVMCTGLDPPLIRG